MESTSYENRGRGKIRIKSISSYELLDANGLRTSQELKLRWCQYKSSNVTAKVLTNYFSSCCNPYVAAIEMMVTAQDFHVGKQNSLTMFVMQTFSSWLSDKPEVTQLLTDAIKLDAFNLLLGQRNVNLINLVIVLYKMKDNKELYVQPLMKFLADTRSYKEACDWATALDLGEHFALEDFVIPLLFQGRFQVAQSFLQQNRDLLMQMVKFLDNLIKDKQTEVEVADIAKRLNVDDVKLNQLGFKPLSKLLTKMTTTYKISPSFVPNLTTNKGRGALAFLINKKFVDKTISHEGWKEMVVEAVRNDIILQMELVMHVTHQGDYKNALEWTEKFDIPKDKWPLDLQNFYDSKGEDIPDIVPDLRAEEELRNEKEGVPYHTLCLPESNIIFIDTLAGLSNFLNDIMMGISMVGVDAEWKPTFGFKQCELALLQIATFEKVYIIDAVALSSNTPEFMKQEPQLVWERFALGFYANPNVTKLGFGMLSDIYAMRDIFHKFGITNIPEVGFLDLCSVSIFLTEECNFIFPFSIPPNERTTVDVIPSMSLSNLVRMCMGLRLDKSDQFSNWERRPLRKSQVTYAALDAYCLLEVYNIIHHECRLQNIFFEGVLLSIKDIIKLRKGTRKQDGSNQLADGTITVSQFRVLCDSPLTELGKFLRRCGVDTVIADLSLDLNFSFLEGDIPLNVITGKEEHDHMRKYGAVYCVKKTELKDQIFEVLKHFNVKVTESDVYSRCKECNSNEFEKITQKEMKSLMTRFTESINATVNDRVRSSTANFEQNTNGGQSATGTEGAQVVPNNEESSFRRKTKTGVDIMFSSIPMHVLQHFCTFLVCVRCGKCYWEERLSEEEATAAASAAERQSQRQNA